MEGLHCVCVHERHCCGHTIILTTPPFLPNSDHCHLCCCDQMNFLRSITNLYTYSALFVKLTSNPTSDLCFELSFRATHPYSYNITHHRIRWTQIYFSLSPSVCVRERGECRWWQIGHNKCLKANPSIEYIKPTRWYLNSKLVSLPLQALAINQASAPICHFLSSSPKSSLRTEHEQRFALHVPSLHPLTMALSRYFTADRYHCPYYWQQS